MRTGLLTPSSEGNGCELASWCGMEREVGGVDRREKGVNMGIEWGRVDWMERLRERLKG